MDSAAVGYLRAETHARDHRRRVPAERLSEALRRSCFRHFTDLTWGKFSLSFA